MEPKPYENIEKSQLSLYNPQYYIIYFFRVEQKVSRVPLLSPETPSSFSCIIRCLSTTGETDSIKVFVSRTDQNKPIISSVVNMPVAEPLTV
jgi:hypothetical protein